MCILMQRPCSLYTQANFTAKKRELAQLCVRALAFYTYSRFLLTPLQSQTSNYQQ